MLFILWISSPAAGTGPLKEGAMTWAHVHLALNHVPVIGLPIAVLLLAWALVRRSAELTGRAHPGHERAGLARAVRLVALSGRAKPGSVVSLAHAGGRAAAHRLLRLGGKPRGADPALGDWGRRWRRRSHAIGRPQPGQEGSWGARL